MEELKKFPDNFIDCCITSPPYWGLRDYGVEGQIGLEPTPQEYVEKLVKIFREVKRVLKKEGTLWLNLGDSYNGSGGAGGDYNPGGLREGQPKYPGRKVKTLKPKDLIGIPWMVAFALRDDDWYLRQDIIWAKPNPLPESVKDRCTKSHEYIFLLSKSQKYFFDYKAIREPVSESYAKDKRPPILRQRLYKNSKYVKEGLIKLEQDNIQEIAKPTLRNKRDVWFVKTYPFPEAHFATFPPDLVQPMILAGCPVGGIVLDPFMGSGTTGLVAKKLGRHYIGIELNPEYVAMAERRIKSELKEVDKNV